MKPSEGLLYPLESHDIRNQGTGTVIFEAEALENRKLLEDRDWTLYLIVKCLRFFMEIGESKILGQGVEATRRNSSCSGFLQNVINALALPPRCIDSRSEHRQTTVGDAEVAGFSISRNTNFPQVWSIEL